MTAKTYDPKCYDLAVDFLEGSGQLDTAFFKEVLAREIQYTIDEFIKHAADEIEPPETGDAWTGGFADNH